MIQNLAIAYTSRDRPELVRRTLPALLAECDNVMWFDGSVTEEGIKTLDELVNVNIHHNIGVYPGWFGGPDYVIVTALEKLLRTTDAEFIGLLESDVLLSSGWREATMRQFHHTEVGAASARSVSERVWSKLNDQDLLMTNLGAGHIVFRREVAELILANYRPRTLRDVQHTLCCAAGAVPQAWDGDSARSAWRTADWGWEAIMLEHGWFAAAPGPTMAVDLGSSTPLNYVDDEVMRILTARPLDLVDPETIFDYARRMFQDPVYRDPSTLFLLHDQHETLAVVPYRLPRNGFTGTWTAKHDRRTMNTICFRGVAGAKFETVLIGERVDVCVTGATSVAFAGEAAKGFGPFEEPTVLSCDTRRYGAHPLTIIANDCWLHWIGFDMRQRWFGEPFDPSKMPPPEV